MKRLQQLVTMCAFMLGCGTGASALAAAEPTGAAKAALAKDAVCTACHNESWPSPVLSIYQSRHGNKADSRTPACQDCHGRSDAHVKSPVNVVDVYFGAVKPGPLQSTTWPKTPSTAEARNGACLACHEKNVLARTNWTGSQHDSQGVACTNCHNIHAPDQRVLNKATQAEVCFACHKTERAMARRLSSHPLTPSASGGGVKMACSDCHNPHGSTGPKLLVKNSVNETCHTCHAEKRGPFLWEHMPASDDCTLCHQPHGSSNVAMLKLRPPFLCQQCHQDHGRDQKGIASIPNAPGNPAPNVATPLAGYGKFLTVQGNGRMCVNCHVMVHGSNHPAGASLER